MILHTSLQFRRIFSGFAIYALLMCTICCGQTVSAGRGKSDPLAVRQAACEKIQASYDAIASANPRDPAIQEITAQLALLDDTCRDLLRQIGIYKTAFLNRSLATVSDSGEKNARRANIDSIQLIEIKTAAWPRRKGASKLNQADLNMVQDYYAISVRALTQLVQSRAQACITATTEATHEVVRLGVVLPLLTTTDDSWASLQAQNIPAWMVKPDYVRSLEAMALRIQRPRTAMAISNSGRPAVSDTAANAELQYANYLQSGANSMLRDRQYALAITYLRQAAMIANVNQDAELSAALRFQIAEVLGGTDSAQAAAEEIKAVMADSALSHTYGKAAMLRLKYLYQGNQNSQVIEEARRYQADSRCAGFLPQIYYIAWVSARKNHADENDIAQWQNTFLSQFPDHPLGADMYFAGAMKALASGEYQDALRLLRFVEYRYPNSRMMDKVREIKSRVETYAQGAGAVRSVQR